MILEIAVALLARPPDLFEPQPHGSKAPWVFPEKRRVNFVTPLDSGEAGNPKQPVSANSKRPDKNLIIFPLLLILCCVQIPLKPNTVHLR
jgi:hypothetical protein